MAGRSREYDIAFRLNALMDSSFRRTTDNAERQIEELERAIREMSQNGGFDDLRRDARESEGALDRLRERAESFGDTLNRVAEFTGAKALIDMASGSMQNIVGTITDQDDAMAQLQASTGMTVEEMERMNGIAKDLYKQNYGEGFDDLGAAMAVVKQTMQQTGDELEQTTKTAITFRDVFDEDIPESLKAADTMMRNFGVTSEQAYNLLAQGAQQGLNKAGDLLDSANEYSVYFKTLGYDAEEMFDKFAAGIEAGAFNLDKVGDSVKEFGIRIKDGSDGTAEAMSILFAPENIEEYTQKLMKGSTKSAEYMELLKHVSKNTAAQLVKDLKAGGNKSASAYQTLQGIMGKGNKILTDLSTGAIQGKDAMQMVIDKLGEVEDPIQRSTIGVALFGTQFEDMEAGVIAALGTTRDQFDMTKQTMEEVAAVKMDTLSKQFQAVGREIMTDLVIPIGEDLMPALEDVAHWASDNKKLLEALALGAPAAMIGKNAYKLIKNITSVERAAEGAAGSAGLFAKALGFMTNPLGLALTGVGLLTAGTLIYKKRQDEAREAVLNMGQALDEAEQKYNDANQKAQLTNNLIWQYDQLSKNIGSGALNSKELAAQQERLKKVTQELQSMFPQLLSNHDMENEKWRERVGLAKDVVDSEVKLAKITLKKEVAEGKNDMPKLEGQIVEYRNTDSQIDKVNKIMEPAIASLQRYDAEYKAIMMQAPSNERAKQLEELRVKTQEVANEAGFVDGRYSFNTSEQLSGLSDMIDMLNKQYASDLTNQEAAAKKLETAESSYQALYDKQKELIELNLGGSLDEQAVKYKKMSDAEKKQFDQAMQDMAALNEAMDLLPTTKKVNLELVWQQTGQVPDLKTSTGQKLNRLALRDPGFEGYADGGIATKPSIFGEAGPEIAIPLNNKSRSHALLDTANDMMGHGGNTHEYQVVFAPRITIQGGGPDVSAQVNKVIQDQQVAFERRMAVMIERRERVSMRK